MKVEVLRRLTVQEVLSSISKLEGEYGLDFKSLQDLQIGGKLKAQLYDAYEELASLMAAYRAYLENGELDYVAERVLNVDDSALKRLLSPKRLKLLSTLVAGKITSINELARKLRRDVKNVYYDLKFLQNLGLVQIKKHSKGSSPEPMVYALKIYFKPA